MEEVSEIKGEGEKKISEIIKEDVNKHIKISQGNSPYEVSIEV